MKALVRTVYPRRRGVLATAGLMLAACLVPASSSPQTPAAKANDLDAFMARVLEKRDENWRKLHDYILSETESLSIGTTGRLPVWSSKDAEDVPLNGFRREYMWYVRDGYLIRSPLRYDGVTLSEKERRDYEAKWLKEERDREKKAKEKAGLSAEAGAAKAEGGRRGAEGGKTAEGGGRRAEGGAGETPALKDLVDERGEPRFISEAYFIGFKFEPGHYYLAGRETFEGRQVLKIEYYPANLFNDEEDKAKEKKAEPGKPSKKKTPAEDAEDQKIERDMNKVSLVTLWVEPTEHQIVKYTFDNTDFGFLPARWLLRIDHITASMTMSRVLDGVWLPGRISMQGGITFATGTVAVRYERRFYDYKKAEAGARVRMLPAKRP